MISQCVRSLKLVNNRDNYSHHVYRTISRIPLLGKKKKKTTQKHLNLIKCSQIDTILLHSVLRPLMSVKIGLSHNC